MKKVFLVYPPSVQMNRTARCQQPVKELIVLPPIPPTDLMYCASIAEKAGYECKIKDYSVENGDLETLKQDIKDFNPDYIVLNIASTTFETDMNAVIAAKEAKKDIITILEGAHFLTFNKSVLEKYKEADIIIRGEVENTFKDIIEGILLSEIKGITYRKGREIFHNENREFIENLDELPLPARHLIKNELYIRPDTGEKQAIIRVSAGCPYHCFFCLATPVSGSKARYRSAENIISEIKECVEKYDIKNFVFWSDLFTANPQTVIDLCRKIKEENLNITWSANSRVDTINEELIKVMKDAGCTLMSFGIESGSQEILDKIGKKITKEQAIKAIKLCKKFKMKTFAYFVLGLPWENKKHIIETIKFSLKLDPDYVNYYTATVLPGSRFYEYVKTNGLEDLNNKDFYKNPYYYPCVKTEFLTKDEIKNLHKYAVKKFYLRPKYILKKLQEIKNLSQLKNYIKAGLNVVFKK